MLFIRQDAENNCNVLFTDTLHLLDLKAIVGFENNVSEYCVPADVQLVNNSTNSTSWVWQLENGQSSTEKEPQWHFDVAGDYPISLTAKHDGLGCVHTTTFNHLTIHPLPIVSVSKDTVICVNSAATLTATGGVMYEWWPPEDIAQPKSNITLANPKNSEWFQVTVTDENGCVNYGATNVYVQQKPTINLLDTTLIIGEQLEVNIADDAILSYQWSPNLQLSCNDCPTPIIHGLETMLYHITVTDTTNCFTISYPFQLDVRKVYSVDLPDAFTPNGDNINDVVYVRGWGIKELITFKIYNRAGRLLFESNDIEKGWDGSYKAEPQPVETYTYIVQVRTYEDQILTKTGAIKLLR